MILLFNGVQLNPVSNNFNISKGEGKNVKCKIIGIHWPFIIIINLDEHINLLIVNLFASLCAANNLIKSFHFALQSVIMFDAAQLNQKNIVNE